MYHLDFPLALFLLGVHLLSIIFSQWEVLQAKQSIFENANFGYFHWITVFWKGYILVDTNNRLLSLAKDSRCLYIQYIALLDDVAYQVYLRHLLIIENEIIWGCRGWSTAFRQPISFMSFYRNVSPDRNSVWLPYFDDLSISVYTISFSEC